MGLCRDTTGFLTSNEQGIWPFVGYWLSYKRDLSSTRAWYCDPVDPQREGAPIRDLEIALGKFCRSSPEDHHYPWYSQISINVGLLTQGLLVTSCVSI